MAIFEARPVIRNVVRIDRKNRQSIVLMSLVIIALLVTGIALLSLAVPGNYSIEGTAGAGVFGWATGILAFTLGIRHAFDADHIVAIDNTTRKLAGEGKRAMGVGFFFSLGHSTIVFVITVVLSLGIAAVNLQLEDSGSLLHRITDIVGPSVSALFLLAIAVINTVATIAMVRAFRGAHTGGFDEERFEDELNKRGLMSRIFGRLIQRVDASWKIYPIGVLFGLGIDTATEVTLLVVSGVAGLGGLPCWAVLSLPLLFAAGMGFFDTLDGVLMNFAYDWAFLTPVRKVYYNVVITVMSVFTALVIGLFEVWSVAATSLGWENPALEWFGSLKFLGFAIAAMLLTTWLIAMLVWRIGRFDEKLAVAI
jgi:high-affinity nickel-transport protein